MKQAIQALGYFLREHPYMVGGIVLVSGMVYGLSRLSILLETLR